MDATRQWTLPNNWRYQTIDATKQLTLPDNWRYQTIEANRLLTLPSNWRYQAIDCTKRLIALDFQNLIFPLQTEGEDELKKRQLMELAIMNGTYRDSQSKNSSRKSFRSIFRSINWLQNIKKWYFMMTKIVYFALKCNFTSNFWQVVVITFARFSHLFFVLN